MKKKAVCMLLGVLLTGTLLTGCGKNKATEAASESAQTEKEGTGERTADSAEDDQKKTDMIRFFFMQIMSAPNRCLRSSRWQPKRYLPW